MLELLSKESIMSEYPLKKIIRYNHRSRLQDESVAEHTCFVSLFCLKIMAQLNLTHEQERQVLILAALHDTCESRTSDIPHDVKANYPEMQQILYQWCLNEKALGNSSDCIGEIYFESKERLEKYTNEINKLIEKEAK